MRGYCFVDGALSGEKVDAPSDHNECYSRKCENTVTAGLGTPGFNDNPDDSENGNTNRTPQRVVLCASPAGKSRKNNKNETNDNNHVISSLILPD